MTPPETKVSREEAMQFVGLCSTLPGLSDKHPEDSLAYLRAVVAALEPEPSAVEELIAAAQDAVVCEDGWIARLSRALAGVRGEGR